MDYYIEKFNATLSARVLDYAVYMQKRRGFAWLNPFSVGVQLVLYITERGNYIVRVSFGGSFSTPVPARELRLRTPDQGKILLQNDGAKKYRFIRKWKEGEFSSRTEFVEKFFSTKSSEGR